MAGTITHYFFARDVMKNVSNERKFEAYKHIFVINNFNDNVKELLNCTFNKVFEFDNFSSYYLKSIKDMKLCFRLLRYDPIGYKKYLFCVFDVFSTKRVLNSKFLSYTYVPKNDISYLNNEHNEWIYPHSVHKKSNESFDEIYESALNKCCDLIIKVFDYIEKNKELDINSLFSLSYITGINWAISNSNPKYEF